MNNRAELKMNGNMAKSNVKPPACGGGTVYPIPIAWPIDACRFAGGSRSRAVVSSLTLDRYEGACVDGVSASRAEQSRASNPLLRKSFPASCAEHVSQLNPAQNLFPYASCADISGSGRRSFFLCRFAGGASRLGRLALLDRKGNAGREGPI